MWGNIFGIKWFLVINCPAQSTRFNTESERYGVWARHIVTKNHNIPNTFSRCFAKLNRQWQQKFYCLKWMDLWTGTTHTRTPHKIIEFRKKSSNSAEKIDFVMQSWNFALKVRIPDKKFKNRIRSSNSA